jgi:hypothetical protein
MLDMGLDDAFFWGLDSRRYLALTDRHKAKSKAEELQLGMLCALTANANFKHEGGGVFEAEEFMPTVLHEQAQEPVKVLTPEETLEKIRLINKMLGGVEVDLNG